ncbi:signal recognition particle receptor FtsY [Corynebacterium pelargi]|uniref:Signal recognition particle receptor FtsY n=2 Tax=Corynebacterium pelargi TaxID=1471400 RepID=A0A410W825_9CORY|nr:Signal recognition particle receptor FtsY [Corynebacterium pelargi]GGG70121.1 signal recognition particle receptor FtsY [Corynebacterium pelargi]
MMMYLGIAVVALLLLIALVVWGLKRKRSKTISFEAPEQKELSQADKSGNYQATGGFNFQPAAKEPVLRDDQSVPAKQQEAKAPFDLPQAAREQDGEPAPFDLPDTPREEEAPAPFDLPETPREEDEPFDQPDQDAEAVEQAPESEEQPELEDTFQELEEFEEDEAEEEPLEHADPEQPIAPVETEPAVVEQEADQVVEAETSPREEIAPAAGRIGKLRGRLSRSQNVIGKSVLGMLTAGDLDEDAWEDIEAQLIQADLGVNITTKVVDQLREKIAERGVESEQQARAMLRECLIDACKPDMDRSIKAMPYEGKPAVVLVVGVNGTGKTTTTGKLARVLVSMGHKVTLGAADTFRAAAADQLETWGRRVGAKTVRGAEGADPASVAFDAVAKGVEEQADVVVIDTAGRLHNSSNLMDQLGKVKRVVEKKAKVDEVLLVLDATTGQNGLTQARIFSDVVQISGVVLTKLDGTAKGGIVFQVQEELGVPVKLVGLGEGADDLAPFEVEGFVDALLG